MKAIIIGSGIAGIATAIRLSHQGFAVHVYESANGPGGKINEFVQDGFRFDAGPSLLTLPSLIDELFTLCGKRPEDYFRYVRLSKINKYFFEDGTTLEASADVNAFAEEVNKVTGEPLVHVLNYLKKSESLYRLTAPVFLKQSLHLASS
ncbi:MAG: NAD(P)-binding protein, partial [Chitinophagales bacterium]|nr:NAD(P)-binding protein [Chitinophagales bacterium]